MRSIEAFKILAHDTRPMEETTSWSPPSISRIYELTDANGRGTQKHAGYSTETHGTEHFFAAGGKAIGHTAMNADNHRNFFDAEGHKIGHEVEGGVFHPEHRHVHVHRHEARQAAHKGHPHTR